MLGEKHDLIHELPEYRDEIHNLKMNNHRFARLFSEYHELDHEIIRIEGGAEATSDDYLEGQKKRRLGLKDELFTMIKASEGSAAQAAH
ncbi:MAG: GTP-binding protein [Gammaproteobacteria bacterium]|nr:MAG: GTP-binding protein [Gammaproteobacteria bacterium]RLA19782.1 MAG: GTP-binding protein [Gammaproteobacteria bacterium]